MNIHYKIIKKDLENRQIIVRFFTDLLTEISLAAELNYDGTPVLGADDFPTRCKTDYLVTFPLKIMTLEEKSNIIMSNCPVQWLVDEERLLKAMTIPDEELEKIGSIINSVPDTGTFNHKIEYSDEELKDLNIKKIDSDIDRIYYSYIGSRTTTYAQAEAQALNYKASGYSGTVPPYVQSWLSSNTKGISNAKKAANDIIEHANKWRNVESKIYETRLLTKKNVKEGVDNTMAQWSIFVNDISKLLNII